MMKNRVGSEWDAQLLLFPGFVRYSLRSKMRDVWQCWPVRRQNAVAPPDSGWAGRTGASGSKAGGGGSQLLAFLPLHPNHPASNATSLLDNRHKAARLQQSSAAFASRAWRHVVIACCTIIILGARHDVIHCLAPCRGHLQHLRLYRRASAALPRLSGLQGMAQHRRRLSPVGAILLALLPLRAKPA